MPLAIRADLLIVYLGFWFPFESKSANFKSSGSDGQGQPYDERGWTTWERMFKFLVMSRT